MLKQITIHKNMSLKDIKPHHDHFKRITPLKIIHMAKNQTQEVPKRYLAKNAHVNQQQKNYFSFNTIHQIKRQVLSVSHQSNNKTKQANKQLNDRYVDLKIIQDQEQKIKQQGYEKQNLIPSNNLKNTQHLIKNSKKTFYNTQKYQSLKHIQIYGVTEGLSQNKNFKKKLLSNLSKTKLVKLPTQQNEYIITEQSQKMQEQCSKGFPKTFRKGILQHIFHVSKHKQKGIQCPKIKNDSIVGSLSLAQSRVETQQNGEDKYPQSQRSNASNNVIFASECSTIEQKMQNNSSFISKKGINNLIQTIDQNIECSILDLKDKKRKLDFDKFKKKFPQNFFK